MKKILCLFLSVIMVFSVAITGLTAIAEEKTAPTMDGNKDACYTDAKMIITSTAYAGSGGAACVNGANLYTKTYFDWDDTNIYLYVEFYDPYDTSTLDLVYFTPYIDTGSSAPIFTTPNGGYMQATVSTGTVDVGGNFAATVKKGSGKGYRSYEFSVPKNTTATGFTVSPVIYVSDKYVVACDACYYNTHICEKVYYDDSSSWNQTTYIDSDVDMENSDDNLDPLTVTIDGVKDKDVYTTDKMTVISTAYAGFDGAKTTNSDGQFIKLWYNWDNDNTYVFVEMYGTSTDDFIYCSPSIASSGFLFQDPGGWYMQKPTSTTATKSENAPANIASATLSNNGRSYEFTFPRGNSAGFNISPVMLVSDTLDIAYSSKYNVGSNSRHIYYNNKSSWTDSSAFDSSVDTSTEDDPGEAGYAILDGKKDAVYTEDKKTVISQAVAGAGQEVCANYYDITTTSYYVWDDDYIYIYAEVYDPYGKSMTDLFYFSSAYETDSVNIFQLPHGAYYQNTLSTSEETTAGNIEVKYRRKAITNGRAYEFKIAKGDNIGFTYSPVVLVSDKQVICYNCTYYVASVLKKVAYSESGTWSEEKLNTFPTSSEKIKPVEDAINALPNPVTEADAAAVNAAKALYKDLPSEWQQMVDKTVYNKLKEAIRIIEGAPLSEQIVIDGQKDSVYTDDKLTIISNQWNGAGGQLLDNEDGLFIKLWYEWDDEYICLFLEYYDPNNLSQTDVIHYISGTASSGLSFQSPNGGYLEIGNNVVDYPGLVNGQINNGGNFKVEDVKILKTSTGRNYEIKMKRMDSDAFTIAPLMYINKNYTISYACNYYVPSEMKVVYFNDDFSWYDDYMTDLKVITSPEKITEVEELISYIPATNEEITDNNRHYVDDAYKAYKLLPVDWRKAIKEDLRTRLLDAAQYLIEKDSHDIIDPLVERINNLPEVITLDYEDEIADIYYEYESLSDDLKSVFPKDALDKLNAAIEALDATPGDIDGNGNITADDALKALQASVNKITLEGKAKTAADVTKDGEITAADALLILQFSVGKIKKF